MNSSNPSRFVGIFLLTGLVLACHLPVHAQDSPHGPLTFDCEDCHKSTSWKAAGTGSQFNHARTAFALKGQHTAVSCRQCHTSLRFADVSPECRSCHTDIHRGELGTLCERCHSPASWLVPDMAQRHSRTRFVLAGPHMTLQCESCHRNLQKHQYLGLPIACYGCHKPDYDATTSPPHRASGFSTDCQLCHSPSALAWGYGFDHSRTSFKLTGAHAAVPCVQCHVNNRFTGTSKICFDCHQADFQKTTNPGHVAGGFSTDCKTCHTTTAWAPATFNHATSAFPLTGAHVTVPCVQCHENNRYTGTPTICYNCHQGDFQNTTNPGHAAAGFPTDCKPCHNTIAWQPSTYNHDPWFPISAGSKHGPGRWTTCGDCHPAPTNFKVFACVNCHEHLQPAMDSKHNGVRNYKFDSQACYSCHPRGNS